jgi:diguanylate cyclase (GGDEF)-like protein
MSPDASSNRRVAQRAFIVAAVLALAAGGLAAHRLNEARHAGEWVHRTQQRLDALHELRGAVAAIDAAQHALIHLAEESHDGGHHARAAAAVANARALLSDTVQQQRLDTLDSLLQEKLGELSRTLTLIQSGQVDSARKLVRDAESEQRNDRIATLLVHLSAMEHDSLRLRTARQSAHASHARLFVGLGLAASLLLAGAAAWLLRREEQRARHFADAAEAAAEAARQSEGRFRTALDAMLDAFYITRPLRGTDGSVADFEVVETNEAGAVLNGLPVSELRGARLSAILPVDQATMLTSICRDVLESGRRYSREYRLERPRTRGPEELWILLQVMPAAEGVAVTCHDITASKHAEAALAKLARRDELTGLLNRRGFREMAEQALRVARRANRRDVLLSLDLSRFKQINDSHGHPEGDAALREVARILVATLRDSDLIARFGGDEFVVYSPAAGAAEQVERIVERVREAFEMADAAAEVAGRPYHVATGLGFTVFQAGDTLDSMLARADAALYDEKRSQRDRVSR